MLLYDVSNEQSFLNVRKWINDIGENADQAKLPVVIVGNKIDLRIEVSLNQVYGLKIDELLTQRDLFASIVKYLPFHSRTSVRS